MMHDLKKELVRLRVEWAVRAEYFDDQYTSGCVRCAAELGEALKRHMSDEQCRVISEPIAKKERARYEAMGHLPIERHFNR